MSASVDMLRFLIRGRRCAIDAASVREILMTFSLTPVPLARGLVKGVVAYGSQPVAVLDLGPDLAPSREDNESVAFELTAPMQQGYLLIVQASIPGEQSLVQVAISVERVLMVAPAALDQMRPAAVALPYVAGMIIDPEGPTLQIDASAAVAHAIAGLRPASPTWPKSYDQI